ncbi:MAG: hypothetical protein EZS28_018974 [Streblomastix strix]|uniref:CID domain-containing protein n=1 Tax=Streblomastix strix TaxID=222440 RepID=A0A5J4VSG1_9EUKA|nr:MAG: hypothetical protein EZS28_018974 [Streblomastix strix]
MTQTANTTQMTRSLADSLKSPDFSETLAESVAKIPISENRINKIVQAALEHISDPRIVCRPIEDMIQQAEQPSDLRLPGMYIINALSRMKKDGKVFEGQFEKNIVQTTQTAFRTSKKDQEKIKGLLITWSKLKIFEGKIGELLQIAQNVLPDAIQSSPEIGQGQIINDGSPQFFPKFIKFAKF